MRQKTASSFSKSEVIALKALGFLADDQTRLTRFAAATGLDSAGFETQEVDAAFLAGVLDYLLGDEPLLLAFSAAEGLKPEHVARARQHLPGAASW